MSRGWLREEGPWRFVFSSHDLYFSINLFFHQESLDSLVLRAENDWRTRIFPPYTKVLTCSSLLSISPSYLPSFPKGCTFYQVMMTAKVFCERDYVSYDYLLYNVFDNDHEKLNK